MSNRHIIDRNLPKKTFLRFYFPPEAEGNTTVVTMPFFENPQIKETKKARYKRYNLISRSSNLYSYLGAESRKLTVNFAFTLPHLLEEHSKEILSGEYVNSIQSDISLKNLKLKFKGPADQAFPYWEHAVGDIFEKFMSVEGLKGSAKEVLKTLYGAHGMTLEEINYIKDMYGLSVAKEIVGEVLGGTLNLFKTAITNPTDTPNVFSKLQNSAQVVSHDAKTAIIDNKIKAIELIIYWVNIIRTSVTNNAENPLKGPPIVRLNHGTMYQNIPCICTDYSINFDEKWGYDNNTLTPRRIDVKMSLEELRTGDFGKFDQAEYIKRDNLAGWESVISSPNTTDPGWL